MTDSKRTLWNRWHKGDGQAFQHILSVASSDLHHLAEHQINRCDGDCGFTPSALVQATIVRMAAKPALRWQCQAHFLALCAREMREILGSTSNAQPISKASSPCEEEPDAKEKQPTGLSSLILRFFSARN